MQREITSFTLQIEKQKLKEVKEDLGNIFLLSKNYFHFTPPW